jgi:hypothetical protein
VVASDLRNFVKSKQDLYIILTIEGQLHLPPYDDCTMDFMRDALAGRKKLLTNRDLCPVNVPRYKEFNSTNLQNLAMQDDELRAYLPDLTSQKQVINRRFLFNVSARPRHAADHQHREARLLPAGDLQGAQGQEGEAGAHAEQVHPDERRHAPPDHEQQPRLHR